MSDNNPNQQHRTVADEIYDRVTDAMSTAEGIHGPEGYEYVVLMQRIAREALRRAKAAVHFAKADIEVYMRPPMRGERGWWVGGTENGDPCGPGNPARTMTPNAALAEVIQEMDDGGWRAERDYDGAPDEYGMIAVTVGIGGSTLYSSEV